MIEADAGNHRQFRLAYIRRIEAAAETDFYHGNVDAPPHKMHEADGSRHLKKRRRQTEARGLLRAGTVWRAHGAPHFAEKDYQFFRADCFTIDLNPFFDPAQMRRRKQACAKTGA